MNIYKNYICKGLFVAHYGGLNNSAPEDTPSEKLYGQNSFVDTLSNYQFNVSPYSFFQVNSRGAETLYATACEWTMEQLVNREKAILLDVCSGTGTIGLFMADKVNKVIGIDISESACRDAESNAKLNKIENASFICGKAEKVLKELLKSEEIQNAGKNIIAIVDPPRSGLHPSVLKALLRCESIERFVYVSCNPKTMLDNAILLYQPPSKYGEIPNPFKLTRSVCVDMFPHTNHCEMVCLFERVNKSND
ncbi:hypothetical protein AKO1_008165 [Acrasis kona]|uniref:RNA methyltransferase n=1 Tax=Acrasis kona TaxID=1008807 RepID=A0AAW2YNQ0_9EUKA